MVGFGVGLVVVAAACVPTADRSTAVDTFVDTVDVAPGDGVCADAAGDCSLRAAVMEANATAGVDEITLPAGIYSLTIAGAGEDGAATGDLDALESVYLRATGGLAVIDAGALGDRILDTHPGAGPIDLDGLVLTGGAADQGGAIRVGGGVVTARVEVEGNASSGAGGGVAVTSGIIDLAGASLHDNVAGAEGGALAVLGGVAWVENTTVSDNAALSGGGVAVTSGYAAVKYSTITANAGGGVDALGGTLSLTATIVADQAGGADCASAVSSEGYNADSDATCSFGPTDLSGQTVDLGPLQLNAGGDFPSRAPDGASPVVDAIADGVAECNVDGQFLADFRVDQNGGDRALDAGCEIGAVEVGSAPASVVISEFMASNDDTLFDEDGDAEDWLELHNVSGAPFDLTGWHLTDDAANLTKWALPTLILPADGRVVVFASNKDRTGAELHSNFKLSAGGEYLALTDPAAIVVDEFAPEYPAQTTDLAYGRVDDTSMIGFLAAATPGAVNSGEALSALIISEPSQLTDADLTVSISDVGNGRSGTIRYTTDGTEPTAASTEYTGPITVATSLPLRARNFDGVESGPEAGEVYTRVDAAVAATSSDLPIVVVDTFGQTIVDEPEIEASITVFDRVGGTASVAGSADYSGGVGIDIRGRSSASFPKKQYKIELHDAAGSDVDADLLGLGEEEDWILYAPGRFDRSMVANPFMQGLAADVGLTPMETQFIELYLNDGSGPVGADDYAGLYVLMENIKIGPERVDITKLSAGDIAEPEVTGGYLFNVDETDDDEYGFRTNSGFPNVGNPAVNLNIIRPKLDDLAPEQQTWFVDYINEFDDVLFGPDFADPDVGYRSYIDVPSWIDAHILKVLSKEPDQFRFSHYYSLDRGGLIRNDPVWDFDRGLRSDDPRVDEPAELFTSQRPIEFGWWGRLFQDPVFVNQYVARWNQLRTNVLDEPTLHATLDAYDAEIADAYLREDALWGGVAGYGPRFGNGLTGEISELKSWLDARLAFLDGAINDFNVSYAYYEGSFTGLADFDTVAVDHRSVTDDVKLDVRDRDTDFGLRFDACLSVPATGSYTFHVTADDGARLVVNGHTVIELDGVVAAAQTGSGSVALTAGATTRLGVDYYQSAGPFALTVEWEGPGLVRRELNPSDWTGCPLPNDPPVLDPLPDRTDAAGAAVSVPATASDPDADPLTFAATGLPPGVAIDPVTGLITGVPQESGVYAVNVTVDDGFQASRSCPCTSGTVFTWTVPVAAPPAVILNEWNAVASDKLLPDGDPFWGSVLGNGGDWFELVVIEDHTDLRGWVLEMGDFDNDDAVFEITDTFEFGTDAFLGDLRSGTIITISEDLPDDVSYDPVGGDWWINFQANSNDDGAYFTAASQSNFDTNNKDWRLWIRDGNGAVVASPTGEGVGGLGGVGSDEIGELEDDPSAAILPTSLYDDGNDSTFGSANGFDTGFQDFSLLRVP